ncbi:MAG: hypothetical protein AB8B72_11570 [Crocinitomicaceae bacterium]
MKYQRPIIFCTCFLVILCLACTKIEPTPPIDNTPKLPEATKVGANTFGCYINGELFLPERVSYTGSTGISISYNSISKDELRIQATRENDTIFDNVRFTSFVKSTGKTPIKIWEDHTTGYSTFYYYYGDCESYKYIENDTVLLDITYLDTIKRIISGTFEFDLIGKKCDDEILSITDGRFDLRY